MENMTQKQKGILYMILSAFSFAAMQVAVRLTKEIPTMEQIFMRNLFILFAAFFIIRRKKGSLFGERSYQPLLFGRSFFGFLGLITLFYASSHGAQGDVTILNKLSPVFVTLFAVLFLKEKMSPIQVPALILSVLGASIVFRPSFESDPLPLVMALLSAVTSGIAYTFLGYFKDKVDGMTVIMHFSTFSAVCSLPFMLRGFVMPDPVQFAFLILIGVFGSLGQAFITYAYRFAPASEISIYNYSGILFSLLLGFVVLGETVKISSIIGGVLVAAASLMVYFYNGRKI
jgi:drug/metabolite transporter (DMT)-like permease